MQTGGQESPVTRKRAADTAETEFDKLTALKRNAECDPSDFEMEDSAISSLAELWHQEDDLDDGVDLLILQQRDRYVASVHHRKVSL